MIRYFKQWFLNLAINKKLLLILASSLFVLIFIIDFFIYSVYANIIADKIEEQAFQTTVQLSNNFDNKIEIIKNKIIQVVNDPTVQEELTDDIAIEQQDKDNYYSNFRKIRRILVQVYSSVMLEDIEIYADNGDHYYISISNEKRPIKHEALYLEKVQQSNGGILMFAEPEASGNILFLKQIKDERTGQELGIIRFALKKEYLYKSTEDSIKLSKGIICLYDGQLPIFIRNESDMDITDLQNNLENDEQRIPGFFSIRYLSSDTHWKTVVLLSKEEMFKELNQLKYVVILVSMIIYMLVLLFVTRLSRTITYPIEEITSGLKKFVAGDLSVRLSVNRKDELGTMSETFNYAVSQIDELITEVSNMRKLEKELEYKTLQAQINPHFLYNTLDAIYWMSHSSGEIEIAKMILALSNLMRNAIDNQKSITTIAEELKIVNDYLYIQQIRHSDKLTVDYQIDEELTIYNVPKLTLQPLVENAIKHGLSDIDEGGRIVIRLFELENKVFLSISDNGKGISAERMKQIICNLKAKDSLEDTPHVGLLAVHKRIHFLYGKEYGLRIHTKVGKGTLVELVLPTKEERGT
ncbi:sensor histidine kinase [Lederbergia sp. NSJ-179]|uniref:sensor histidine kinase n=1 Tax=Lederbergia sp. NSJ-179 TaxID=2931402 RepID=UPI001FD5A2BA|nr:sensor histidine kinase [Lederbergia sp. NSJ-179]MCJ7842132.1 sensor histidine kinase [Lederbergia sp. NSJ-179]